MPAVVCRVSVAHEVLLVDDPAEWTQQLSLVHAESLANHGWWTSVCRARAAPEWVVRSASVCARITTVCCSRGRGSRRLRVGLADARPAPLACRQHRCVKSVSGAAKQAAHRRLRAKWQRTGMAGKRLPSSALIVMPALGCGARVPREGAAALPARLGCCGAALLACMGEQQPQPTVRAGRSIFHHL